MCRNDLRSQIDKIYYLRNVVNQFSLNAGFNVKMKKIYVHKMSIFLPSPQCMMIGINHHSSLCDF